MSGHDDNEVQEGGVSVERQTIRDAILVAAEERRREEQEQERRTRRQAREERVQKRRSTDLGKARDRKARKLKAANEANARMRAKTTEAARALRGALRAATEVSLPRHSDEGRQQQRDVRALQASLAQLRGIGAGNFDETNFEIDLDLDVG